MRKFVAVSVIALAFLGLVSTAAYAVSPHFVRASGTLNSDGSLTVSFKEAGLGTNQNIDYLLTADATVVGAVATRPLAHGELVLHDPVEVAGDDPSRPLALRRHPRLISCCLPARRMRPWPWPARRVHGSCPLHGPSPT